MDREKIVKNIKEIIIKHWKTQRRKELITDIMPLMTETEALEVSAEVLANILIEFYNKIQKEKESKINDRKRTV